MQVKKEERKILVLGSDGMAGHIIARYLQEAGYVVFTTTRGKTEGKNYHFDVVENYRELERIVSETKPNFVVNCIGVLNQFAEDHHPEAVLINSFLPHFIASLREKKNFKLIHISTDCVFSGSRGKYSETDLPDAVSFYGRTKSLGEVRDEKNVTFRTSIVGPDRNENGIGLFKWFMTQEGAVKGFGKVVWSGVTTLELAKTIERSFDTKVTGLYHLVNNETINKYDLIGLFKKHTGKDVIIERDDSYISDKSLIRTRDDFDFSIPSYEVMVEEMVDWIRAHEELYRS